jgi:O-antigen ligase
MPHRFRTTLSVVAVASAGVWLGRSVFTQPQLVTLILFGVFGLLIGIRLGFASLFILAWPFQSIPIVGLQFTVIRCILLAGVGYHAIRLIVNRRLSFTFDRVFWGLSAFALLQVIWVFFSPNPIFARQSFVYYVFITLLTALLMSLSLTSDRAIRVFLITILLFGFVDAFLSIYQNIAGYGTMPSLYYNLIVSPEVISIYNAFDGGLSAFGLFSERGFNGMFMVLCAYLAFVSAIIQYPLSRRVAWPLLFLYVVGVVISFTRICALTLVLGLVLLALFLIQRSKLKRMIQVIGTLALLTVAVQLIAPNQFRVLKARFGQHLDSPFLQLTASRGYVWLSGLELFAESPWVGSGVGVTYTRMTAAESTAVHSGYLELLIEMGILGLMLWLSVLFIIAVKYIRLLRGTLPFREKSILAVFGVYFLAALVWAYTGLGWKPGWEFVSITYVIPGVIEAVYLKRIRPTPTGSHI